MENNEFKVLIITEKTAIQSIISDIFTFGCLFGGFFVNYRFLGDSLVLQFFLAALIFALILGYSNKTAKKMNPEDALKFLTDK